MKLVIYTPRMLTLVSLATLFMAYSVRSQPTMDMRRSQCSSADQSECCSVNIQFLENMRRGYNPAYTASGATFKNSIKYLLESLDSIMDVVRNISQTGVVGTERYDEGIIKSTHEILRNFVNESGEMASFMSLMAKISTIEGSLDNLSQEQGEIVSLMNENIRHHRELQGEVFQELINSQTWNITTRLSVESSRNNRAIQDSLSIYYNRTKEMLSIQEEKMENTGENVIQLISKLVNQSDSDTTAYSRIEVIVQDRAARIESSVSRTQQQLNNSLQTASATLQELLRRILSQNENTSNVLQNIQPVLLLELAEGQQNENRQAENMIDKIEQLKNIITEQGAQTTSELKQRLEELQQYQNSSSDSQFENLTTYLQQLQHFQLVDQRRVRYMYNNITTLLSDLEGAGSGAAEKIEQVIERQDIDKQEKRQEKEQQDRDMREMKQLLEQLKQEQQQQTDQLKQEQQQLTDQLERKMKQQTEQIKQEQQQLTEQLKQEQQQLTGQLRQEMKQQAEQIKQEQHIQNQKQASIMQQTELLLANQTYTNHLLQSIDQRLSLAKNLTNEDKYRNCPSGFAYSSKSPDRCYKIINRKLTWDGARTNCYTEASGAHLAVILSGRQQEAIGDVINTFSSARSECGADGYFLAAQRARLNDCSSAFEWKPYPEWSG